MNRKIITLPLAILFLFSGTEVHELLRLSPLLSHLKEHQQKDTSMDIWSFLHLHYTADHPDDNDEGDDEELPFKSSAGINHLGILFNGNSCQAAGPFLPVLRKFNIFDTQFFPSGIASGIFHPPCFA